MEKISRREFACQAALAAAVAAIPTELMAQTEAKPAEKQEPAPAEQELSKPAKAEAEQSYNAVMEKYGTRFNDAQKKEIKRLLGEQQKAIEEVRRYAMTNADEPATVLHAAPRQEAPNAAR